MRLFVDLLDPVETHRLSGNPSCRSRLIRRGEQWYCLDCNQCIYYTSVHVIEVKQPDDDGTG